MPRKRYKPEEISRSCGRWMSHDVIHALFRGGDSTSLYGVSHSALSKIETVSDSALSVVEFARCFLEHPDLDATVLPLGKGTGIGARKR